MADSTIKQMDITPVDRTENLTRAALKLIPGVGEAAIQFLFGEVEAARERRVEQILQDLLDHQRRSNNPSKPSEEFANLFERAAPKIARATSHDVLKRFRDLLLNVVALSSDDQKWSEAFLAEQLLAELDGPALAIIARIAEFPETPPILMVSRPAAQIVAEGFDWSNPVFGTHAIGYEWPVVEEWVRRLRDKRLIGFNSSDARGGFGGVYLTELGKLLVRWTISTSEQAD